MEASQEKSLPASERKLHKARAHGQGARSRDMLHLAVLGAGAVGLWLLAPALLDGTQRLLAQQLVFDAATVQAPARMAERLRSGAAAGLIVCSAFAAVTCAAALAGALAAGGWIWSLQPIAPRWGRLNPASGLANLLSRQQLAHLLKLLLLSALLAAVAWQHLGAGMQALAPLLLQPRAQALAQAGHWLATGIGLLLLVLLPAALADRPAQAWLLRTRLRMSHEEARQEQREADGNPHIKGRMRQRQRALAERASLAAVPRADFVLMNPSHYAVALKYDAQAMSAPQVIARAAGQAALRLRALAQRHGVAVLQAPMLARALYAHAGLDRPIPAALYGAVAQVLAHVYRIQAALRGECRMPAELHAIAVPPELDPHGPLDPQLAAQGAGRDAPDRPATPGAAR